MNKHDIKAKIHMGYFIPLLLSFPKLLIYIGHVILWLIESPLYTFRYLDSKLKQVLNTKVVLSIPTIKWNFPKLNLILPIKNFLIDLCLFFYKIATFPFFMLKVIFSRSMLIFLSGVVFASIFIYTPFVAYQWFRELPKPDLLSIEANSVRRSTKFFDRNKKLLYEIYIDKNVEPVKLDQVPQQLIDATLAVEDSEFYSHPGFRLNSIIRAFKANLTNESFQGASTITQQLVKNVLLTLDRTWERKIKELALSVLVERKYTKNQILEMYLNNISYGGNAWGIQSASKRFFNKDINDLTLSEIALIAGLPSAPSAYDPFTNLNLAKDRQKYVLDRMLDLEKISILEYEAALSDPIVLAKNIEYIKAPHFVSLVRKDLEEKYGRRYVELSGLEVITTLDLDLQEKVEQIVREEVEKGKALNFTNASSVVLDPKTGEILAYVGSVDYFKESWGAYDVASSYRQPGSSIKPITYALALEKGYTAATLIDDSPVTYKNPSETYKPVNYDGRYHGRVSLRAALANSYNIPAVKLVRALGPDNMVSLAKSMGLKNWELDGSYGLSVTLGGKEARLLDMSNAYATLARGGVYKSTTGILSIEDSFGYKVENIYTPNEQRVISASTAYIISSILSDNGARTPAFGSNSALVIPGRQVAVKTGTTDFKKDNWTLGYTPSYAVGVWVGNNDNTEMNPRLASGLTGAAPIWNRVMKELLVNKNEAFAIPDEVVAQQDKSCGNKVEYFAQGSKIPNNLCKTEDSNEQNDKKISLN